MSDAESSFGRGGVFAAVSDVTGITRYRGSAADGQLGVLWKSGDRHQQAGTVARPSESVPWEARQPQ